MLNSLFRFDDLERAMREGGLDLPRAMLDATTWKSRRELARRALPGTWVFIAALGIAVAADLASGNRASLAHAAIAAGIVGGALRWIALSRFRREPARITRFDYSLFCVAGLFLPLVWSVYSATLFHTLPADWSRAPCLAFTAAMGASAIYVWGIWRGLARSFAVVLLGPLALSTAFAGGAFGWLVVLGCAIFAAYMVFESDAWNRLHWNSQLSQLQLELQAAELAEAKNAAEAANRAKSDFLTVVSHELRTPMNAILGFAQLLRIEAGQQVSIRQSSNEIIESGQHLMRLIEQILDLTRIEHGHFELQVSAFDPVELAQQVVDGLRPTVSDRVSLRFEPRVSTLEFHGDALRLRQILLNLISNAVKFTPRGEILVALAVNGEGELEITVSDSGIGMSDELVAKIFEPFTQADSSSTRRYGGIGLGLPISKRLVEVLGGTIEVRSRTGEGSRFLLRLPDLSNSGATRPAALAIAQT